jgi:hypothetical protein
MGLVKLAPMTPRPIPLKPDPDAARETSVRSLARATLASARGTYEIERAGAAARLARASWPADRTALALVTRAASSPAETGQLGWASQLAVSVVRDLLAALGPASAGGQLLQLGTTLEWNNAAKILIPGLTASAANATFVGEAQAIPARQLSVSAGPSLVPNKFATIFSLTSEQVMSSHAEELVRMVMSDSLAAAFDAALFSTTAGDTTRPPGLLYGISALPAATGGSNVALLQDLGAVVESVSPVSGLNIALVADPGTAMKLAFSAGREFDLPILASNGVPAKTFIAVGFNALVSVLSEPRIEASRDVEVAMDTVPPQDGSIGSVVLKSQFQTDAVAIKFALDVAWALRTPSALAWISGITW